MMSFLAPLQNWLNSLAATRIVTARIWLRRSAVWAVVAAFLMIAVLAGLTFIAVGGFLSLRQTYTPWEAGLIVGGALLLLALISALVAWIVFERHPIVRPPLTAALNAADAAAATMGAETPVPPPPVAPVGAGVADLLQLGEQLGNTIRGVGIRRMDLVVGALVAGVVFGGSSALRRGLLTPRRRRSAQEQAQRPSRYRDSRY